MLNKNSNREKVQETPAEVRYHATEAECIQLKVQLREIALTLSTLRCKRCLGDPQVQTLFGRRVDLSAINFVPQHIHPRYKIVNPTYPWHKHLQSAYHNVSAQAINFLIYSSTCCVPVYRLILTYTYMNVSVDLENYEIYVVAWCTHYIIYSG